MKTIVIGVIGADVHAVGNKIIDYVLKSHGYNVVNIGVLLDVFIAIYILGLFVSQINKELGDMEVAHLSDLKDCEYND